MLLSDHKRKAIQFAWTDEHLRSGMTCGLATTSRKTRERRKPATSRSRVLKLLCTTSQPAIRTQYAISNHAGAVAPSLP